MPDTELTVDVDIDTDAIRTAREELEALAEAADEANRALAELRGLDRQDGGSAASALDDELRRTSLRSGEPHENTDDAHTKGDFE